MKEFISVIMPAYNEGKRIRSTLENLLEVDLVEEIIVINDGSKDNTREEILSIDNDKIKLITLNKNKGKGNAINLGLKMVDENSTIIGFLDADLEDSSKEAKKLIEPILEKKSEVTIAKFPSPQKKGGLGLVKKLAKESVVEMTGKELDSTLSGQRFFRREVLANFKEIPFGYGVEVGMTIDILNNGFNIEEVPVDMHHNETGRTIKGFIHRGKQYHHIKKIVKQKRMELGSNTIKENKIVIEDNNKTIEDEIKSSEKN